MAPARRCARSTSAANSGAAGLTASALLSACVAPVATTGGAGDTESAPGSEVVTLVYWALDGENNGDNITRGVIDPFHEAYPNVKVELEEIPWDGYYEKYQTLGAAGQAPDLAFVSAAWIQRSFWNSALNC